MKHRKGFRKAWKIRKITWGRHSGALLPLVKSAAFLQLQLERMRTMHNMYQYIYIYQYATPCHGPKTSKTHLWLRVLLFFVLWFPHCFPILSILQYFPMISLFLPYVFPICSLLFPHCFLMISLFPYLFPIISHYFPIFPYLFPICSLLFPFLFPYVFPIISRLCPYLFPIMSLLYISPLFRGSFLHVADTSDICRSIGVLNSSNALGSPQPFSERTCHSRKTAQGAQVWCQGGVNFSGIICPWHQQHT